jgi:MacB-like periplasmic core domain
MSKTNWVRRNTLAIFTLALGIGAATAMFSFVHPMLLHPLLYPRADRLVVIEDRDSKGGRGSSWPEARDIAKAPAFSDAAAWEFGFFFLTGVEEPEQVAGSLVTPNLFRTLGVGPTGAGSADLVAIRIFWDAASLSISLGRLRLSATPWSA